MLDRFDAQSRDHLRAFAAQVGFLAAIGLPLLLLDSHAPRLYLLQLQATFGLSSLIIFALALFSRRPLLPTSLCIWDHCLAFYLLKLGCSLALFLLDFGASRFGQAA